MKPFSIVLGIVALAPFASGATWDATDLNPVKTREAPKHDQIWLVQDGHPKATICLMGNGTAFPEALRELQTCIKLASGAELPVVSGKIVSPAIVIGDCLQSAAIGLHGDKLASEGLAIKSAPGSVFIVGNGYGLQWGIYE